MDDDEEAGLSVTAIATIVGAAAAVGGTAYSIATAPGTPEAPKAPAAPPPPPTAAPPPPTAPSETEAQQAVGVVRKRESRRFGLQNTLFSSPVGRQGNYGGGGLKGTLGE